MGSLANRRFGKRWTLPGDAPIRIERDRHGVPHIRAATEADLYRGLGHCHGVDRALQMLLLRIAAAGRASEFLTSSDDMLTSDRFFRRLDLAGDAGEEARKFSASDLALVAAYCEGVNHALAKRVPFELRLLGYRPEPWTPADVVLVSRAVGYLSLAQSQGEMERLVVELVQAGIPERHLRELFPSLPREADFALLRRIRVSERLVPEGLRWSSLVPQVRASNNWVVAPRKSASGRALLANDPHLEANRLPAVWYEVVAEWGERFCIAATMPGAPGWLLGRTNDLAWGATYSFMDAIDSWIEDCRDGCYRREEDAGPRWIPFRARREVIRRRRRPDEVLTFYENDHGVLAGDPREPGLYLATRWSGAAGTGAASIAAATGILHAPNVEAGMELMGRLENAMNWVFADRHGSIGYQMSGRMPRRRNGWNGLVPLPGWDPRNDWRGFVAPTELPRALDPETGFLVTANHDLNHLGRERPINLPMGPYRAERITERLAERDDWTVAATERLQMDVSSAQAERFLAVLRPLLPPSGPGDILRGWDARYDIESRGAALFERFYRALVIEVFGSRCGREVVRFLADETGILTDFYYNFDRVLLRPESAWFGSEGRDAVFARVAARVLKSPVESWGSVQRLRMKHLFFGGRLPSWLGFDHGPVALCGGRATIHQAQLYRSGGRETSFAPSYRMVTDLGEPTVRTTLAGGPSDRRFSRWYKTGIADWLAGRFKTLRPAQADARASSQSVPCPSCISRGEFGGSTCRHFRNSTTAS